MTPWEERFPRLWAFGEQVAVLVFGSFLFWLFSLPVITLPAALVGLCAAVLPLVHPAGGQTLERFWRGVRRAFGTALLLGLLDLVLAAVLYVDIRFFWSVGTPLAKGAAFFCGSLAALLAMVNAFAWPLLAWFPQPLPKLVKRAFLLTAAHPLHALAGMAGAMLVPLLFWLVPPVLRGLVPALGPGLMALLVALPAWRAMRRYASPDDELTM